MMLIKYIPVAVAPRSNLDFQIIQIGERQMNNYTNNDYALNRYSDGVVYNFADCIKEITFADCLAENPAMTEDDFRALKEFSDSNYLKTDRAENAKNKRNISFHEFSSKFEGLVKSPEELHINEIDAQEEREQYKHRLEIAKRAMGKLTDVQRRRYLMYRVKGVSSHKIAELEGKNHKTILESLYAAEKKLKNNS